MLQVSKSGTMVTIEQCCKECQKDGVQPFKWHSQPFVFGRYAAGNLLLSFAILCAGASVSKTLLVSSHLGLCVYSARTFFAHQKWLLFPTIINFWESTRLGLIEKACLAKESVWAGDGRFDLMGHSAKYGAYTMMNASLGKIMHFELLQVIGIVQFMHIQNSRGPVYEFKTIFKLIH
jgi:solute carrier family 8 (sodium/calcium exchanger)